MNPLPDVDDFTDDERLLARFVVGAIHSGGTMFEGRLIECLLSRVLGADLPPRGVWPWDLRLRDHDDVSQRTRIEVRSGASSLSIEGGQDAHVWILARKATVAGQPPLSYSVAPDYRVRLLRASVKKPTLGRIEGAFGVVNTAELASAVADCSGEERHHRGMANGRPVAPGSSVPRPTGRS